MEACPVTGPPAREQQRLPPTRFVQTESASMTMEAEKSVRIEDLPPATPMAEGEADLVVGAGKPSRRLGVETLEGRELMAAGVTASLAGGVLRVEGTPGADQIRVTQLNGQIAVEGVTIEVAGESQASLPV